MELEDFRTLVRDQKLTGFVDNRAENELSIMLYRDYESGRANAFEYFDMLHCATARQAFELRKSAILPVDDIMPESASLEDIINTRIKCLGNTFMDYIDENWQYWWAQHVLLPKEKRVGRGFLFERFLEDGDVSRDCFEDPVKVWCRRFLYTEPRF